jgi:parallel beta-helix repeat protein
VRIPFLSPAPLVALGLAVAAVAGATGQLTSSPDLALVASTGSCSRWAATAGSDGNAGTQAAPYRSLQKLVASLAPGQTGCLPAGQVYDATEGNGIFRTSNGTQAAPVTLTSGGNGRAQVRGWVLADTNTHDVVVTDLQFLGSTTDAAGNPVFPKSTHINLLGDRITLRDNDITNPYGICVNAGKIDAFQEADPGEPSDDIVVEGNRVHGCGMSPKLVFSDADSGAHGIYLVNTRRARVVENVVYDNRYRGFQQWPTGSGTLVANNVFVRNATQVNVGSALTEGEPWWSTGTTVRDNVMAAKTGYRPEKNQASIAFNYPQGSPTYGNTVTGNCISTEAQALAGYAYTATDNTSATATFVDAAHDDFRLTATSACRGKGPRSIQPTAQRTVSTSTAACSAGQVVSKAPTAATSPATDWLWFRADLYRWDGASWVAADRSRSWLYAQAGAGGLTGGWTRYDTRAAASSVVFGGLTPGAYYAVVQTVAWNADGAMASTVQPMTGSSSTTWCRA